jgi:prepilin-type N-terminal cleavage/methylation domain-containing protein
VHQAMPRRERRSRALRRRLASAHRHARDAQSGYTLIEVVIAVALSGLVILSLATAMLTIVRTNALSSERQRVDAAMTSFSESVQASPYLPCADHADYTDSFFGTWTDSWTVPDGALATIDRVDYWDAASSSYVDGCSDQAAAHRLTLSVSWGELTRNAQIVKRSSP